MTILSAEVFPAQRRATSEERSISLSPRSKDPCHRITDPVQLYKSVETIGDWKMLCSLLGVKEATVNHFLFSDGDATWKKYQCLKAYLDLGHGCWEMVVKVICSFPFYNIRLARTIAEEYDVSMVDVVCDT